MKRNSRRFIKAVLSIVVFVIALVIVVGIAWAAVVLIDDFNNDAFLIVSTSTPAVGSVDNSAPPGPGTALGGELDFIVTRTSASGTIFWQVLNGVAQFGALGSALGTVEYQWDGTLDSPKDTIDYLGLQISPGVGIDLTSGGANDGITFAIVANDWPATVTATYYTSATACSSAQFATPGSFGSPVFGSVQYYLLLGTDFTQDPACSAPGSPGNVGAFVVFIDATASGGTDVDIDFVNSTFSREYGDLPTNGEITPDYSGISANAASHIPRGLTLGLSLDTEELYQSSQFATGDNVVAVDDEDGVVRTPGVLWTQGSPPTNGGSIDVSVNGCVNAPCSVNGWIDWNKDGDFADAGEQILTNQAFPADPSPDQTFTFPIPVPTGSESFYARFRVCDTTDTCNSVSSGGVNNGEIEDYFWSFSPTAIAMGEHKATGTSNAAATVTVAGLVLGLGAITVIWGRKRMAA